VSLRSMHLDREEEAVEGGREGGREGGNEGQVHGRTNEKSKEGGMEGGHVPSINNSSACAFSMKSMMAKTKAGMP